MAPAEHRAQMQPGFDREIRGKREKEEGLRLFQLDR
jgi:hypothetical protein